MSPSDPNQPATAPARRSGPKFSDDQSTGADARAEIILRVKRANVFTQGISDDIQATYQPKVIRKTEPQEKTIRKRVVFNESIFIYLTISTERLCNKFKFKRRCIGSKLRVRIFGREREKNVVGRHGSDRSSTGNEHYHSRYVNIPAQ
jgi:hypothetical protein